MAKIEATVKLPELMAPLLELAAAVAVFRAADSDRINYSVGAYDRARRAMYQALARVEAQAGEIPAGPPNAPFLWTGESQIAEVNSDG